MAQDVKVPALGESITEATVARWLKQVGDSVHMDEPIAELETDKINVEVNAPVAGTLTAQKAKEGDTVKPDALIAVIDESAKPDKKGKAKEEADEGAEEETVDSGAETETSAGGVRVSPAARKIAKEKGLDLAAIEGSGKGGLITKEDVVAATSESTERQLVTQSESGAAQDGVKRVKMSRLRQRIAERLKEAQSTAAILTTFNEIDMSVVMETRQKYKEAFIEKYGVKLGFMSFFTQAVLAALHKYPVMNAEIEGDEILYKSFFNIGIAVGTDQGLVVPVIKNAEHMEYHEIEQAIGKFAEKAQAGKLALEDLQGGTFTISNGGTYGSLLSTPILNPPQSGILGLHKIEKRAVVVDDQVVIRPMMYVALSYDHRLVDGKEAVGFLVAIKQFMEDPTRLLLNV
ncbi:MAG: dihydrolipoyllysine-residue succinyltransferase [Rickettsiales bacterium]|nr:dihydrolipoyllysine-residue succinyltransferase [Rickettsiales bacterium]|tara:strand:+ start:4214 stop:5422 length:1209 start_codon:yes stop_codon:yes gene_type:complete